VRLRARDAALLASLELPRLEMERAVARWEASLTRWASPPERVVADWPRRT